MAKANITVKSGKKRGSTITRAEARRAVNYVNQVFGNKGTAKYAAVTLAPTTRQKIKAK